MIKVIGRKFQISNAERTIGFEGDNLVETREFLITQKDLLGFTFKLDTQNGDIIELKKTLSEDGESAVLVWDITSSALTADGEFFVQLRAFDENEAIWHSDKLLFFIGSAFNAQNELPESTVSEFAQIEANVADLYKQMESQVKSAENSATNAQSTLEEFEAQRDALEEQLNQSISLKADKDYVDENLTNKADKTYVDKQLTSKVDNAYLESELTGKADITYVDSKLSNKSDTAYVNSALSAKANITYVNEKLSAKADTTYVNGKLSAKADIAYVNEKLENKADLTYVDAKIVQKTGDDTSLIMSQKAVSDNFDSLKGELTSLPSMCLKDSLLLEEVISMEEFTEIKDGYSLSSNGDFMTSPNYKCLILYADTTRKIRLGSFYRIYKYNGEPSSQTLIEKSIDKPALAEYIINKGEYLVATYYTGATPKMWKYEKYMLGNLSNNKVKVEKSDNEIYVYIYSSNGIIKYPIKKITNNSTNCDTFHIHKLFSVKDGVEREICYAGEFEMAVKIKDRDDFIGGSQHGDEKCTSYSLYCDGISVTENKLYYCDECKIIVISDMYDPADHTTIVATHYKEYIFTHDGLELNQRIMWASSLTLMRSYLAMLPILRKDGDGNQITDTYFDNVNYTEYDVSDSGFTTYPITYRKDCSKQNLYSSISKISASVEVVTRKPYIEDAVAFLSNSEYYNKIYFGFCGDNYQVNSGDMWTSKSIYKIRCN